MCAAPVVRACSMRRSGALKQGARLDIVLPSAAPVPGEPGRRSRVVSASGVPEGGGHVATHARLRSPGGADSGVRAAAACRKAIRDVHQGFFTIVHAAAAGHVELCRVC
jgi:hypothetical protein